MDISTKQSEMLAFIEGFIESNGYPPTYEEIRVGLGASSKSLVNHHLEALENAGLLTRTPNRPRSIRLTNEGQADGPQAALRLVSGIMPEEQEPYTFQTADSSMVEALINKGDIVVMQPQTQARNGEMVAVHLTEQGQTTFRRYYRENGHVRLQPDNPAMDPIIVKPEAIEIQGKVIAVIRQMA